MRIAYLAAGAAGMYCGTCLHDNTLAAALLELGEDVLLVPTYTPLRTDEMDVSQHRVFFGGINVYLQQKLALFRHTPWFFDKLFDSPRLLNWVSRGDVDASHLGDLTVSMLQGTEGRQRKELEKLVGWLAQDVQPDVVHLSNALMVSMATEIRRAMDVPIVCALSGEDVFLERVPEPHYSQARGLMRQHAAAATAFTSLNRYYADFMVDYIGLDPARVHVIRHGLKLDGHGTRRPRSNGDPVTIGYFARVHHDKGLHQLVEAMRHLADDATLPPFRVKAAGFLAKSDRPYLNDLLRRLKRWKLADRFSYHGEPDRAGKIDFLQSLDFMCIPTVYRESKGLSVLEAMANSVPVVLPAHGAFPELIEDTGGGLLFEPGNIESLAEALKRLLREPALVEHHGRLAGEAIRDRYHAPGMARQTLELYRRLLEPRPSEVPAASMATRK